MYRDERGVASFVEAAIYLPFCILSVLVLLYASLFLTIKANLQSSLQSAIIYFKNEESDTYVVTNAEMSMSDTKEADIFEEPRILNPYRLIFMKFDEDQFQRFVSKLGGYMFFSRMSDVTISAKRENYMICKRITASAEVEYKPALSLYYPMLSVDKGSINHWVLRSSASCVITDGDEIIRNIDLINDVTGLGDDIGTVMNGVTDVYREFRDMLGVS